MQAMEQFIVCEEAITTTAAATNPPPRKREDMTNGLGVTFSEFDQGRNNTNSSEVMDSSAPAQQQLHKRGLSLFGDENVSDAIISGVLISGGP
jgi:hypothetical protein